ncbi:unnamed protein product [Aureobasidium pullulans]|nr:unnamed protein product [Aureobasidium pullulans]
MIDSRFTLDGKIALVTGGGCGIGLAFVHMAAKAGTDVRKRGDLENAITVSTLSFGDVPDVYVANAGVFEPQWSNFWLDTEGDSYATAEISE